MDLLLSTLAALPDDEQAAVERELVTLTGAAVVGELAADIAHDLANPLLGAAGLVELLRGGPDDAEQLALVASALAELKETLASLLELTRLRADDAGSPVLADAARAAVAYSMHGTRRSRRIDVQLADDGARVPCPRGLLVQAIMQLLIAGDGDGRLSVSASTLRLAPAPPESVTTCVALRILRDSGADVSIADGGVLAIWSL